MSEIELEALKKKHAQYVFVYQRLAQSTQYFVEEFEIAQDAIKEIKTQAEALTNQLRALLPQPAPEENEPIVFEMPQDASLVSQEKVSE